MHTIKITANLLFEYQCTSAKFIRLPNRIEKIDSVARIESNRNFFLPELECSTDCQCAGTGTFRSHALSFPGMKRPHSGRFVPGNESVGVIRPRERNCLVTFVLMNCRLLQLSLYWGVGLLGTPGVPL